MPDKTSINTRPESEPHYSDLLDANEAMGRRIDELEATLAAASLASAEPLTSRYWPVSS